MPSADDWNEMPAGFGTAVAAESLYLANLLVLPGIAFVLLLVLAKRQHEPAPLAVAHLQQTIRGSIWAGLLLILVNILILLLGGYDGPNVWAIVITYFTTAHGMLVLFGAYGLAKAMAGQCWRYPLIGRPLPPGCR